MKKLLIALLALLLPGMAQAATGDFYQGKTIRIVVGYGAGGGYDLYARLLARHMDSHIPGQPTIIIQNMPGAGGLLAANDVYVIMPKDGTVIAAVNPIVFLYQLLGGAGTRYQTAKLNWIGSLDDSNNSIIMWTGSGITTLADAEAHEALMGGDSKTASANTYVTATNALLGTKFKLINGYGGSNAMDLAMEKGEIAGRSGASLTSIFARHEDWVKAKKITFLLQFGYKRDPALPDVPLLQEMVKSDRDRQIATTVTLPTTVGPAYWLAPEVPADRVAVLRQAFSDTVADPAFLADAKKLGFGVETKSGAQLQAAVQAVAALPPEVLSQTKTILGW